MSRDVRLNSADSAVTQEARHLHRRGRTPVGLDGKRPTRPDWQQHTYVNEVDVITEFTSLIEGSNLGVVLGRGLADVDLDCPEAIKAASHLLPLTPRQSGRESAPRSHWWYATDHDRETFFHLKDAYGGVVVELRADSRHQTVVPPSVHPDTGEPYRWEGSPEAEPAKVDLGALGAAVAALGLVSVLAPHWPRGSRHEAYLALVGGLLRGHPDDDRLVALVEKIVQALVYLTKDEEHPVRVKQSVPSTRKKLRAGDQQVTGWTTLREHVAGEHVAAAMKASDRMRECLELRVVVEVDDDAQVTSWGRVDLLNKPKPKPPSVGKVSEGVYLFIRGRRHVLYGEGETGKSWGGFITAAQEAANGNAAIIINGEMSEEDVASWLLDVLEVDPTDVVEGLFVYPSDGLLTLEQRKVILEDLAASGRELTFVFVDSQTSVLSQSGLDPNKAEDIESLWRELGGWFIGLPSRPAFVMTDHVSKGADGKTPTGSIRKRNVVDLAFLVENVSAFSPETQHGPARSGFSTLEITKGRQGGRGLKVARIIGHEEKVTLGPPEGPLPWIVKDPRAGQAPSLKGVNDVTLDILRIVAKNPTFGTDKVVQALGQGQTVGYSLVTTLAVDEENVTGAELLIRRKVGKTKVPTLTERGREVLRQADEVTSTSTTSTRE